MVSYSESCYPACVLRAVWQFLADGAPHRPRVGASVIFVYEIAVTGKRKVEKSIRRCQINRRAEGYKRAPDEIQIFD